MFDDSRRIVAGQRVSNPAPCACCGHVRDAVLRIPGRRPVIVRVADITHMVAIDKCVEVWTPAGMAGLLTGDTLESMMRRFPGEWVRCHRAAIVRLRAITRYEAKRGDYNNGATLHLIGGNRVDASRREWLAVREALR